MIWLQRHLGEPFELTLATIAPLAAAIATSSSLLSLSALTPGLHYLAEVNVSAYTSGTLEVRLGGDTAVTFASTGVHRAVFRAQSVAGLELYGGGISADISGVSVRRLIPREDL